MVAPLLAFEEVGYRLPGGEPLFSGLDLALEPGQALMLTSPLGGGKSTALRMALGLAQPSEGSVRVFGLDPGDERQRELLLPRVGWVPQEGSLLSNLTLWDNLVLPLRYHRDPAPAEVEARARAALAIFGLERVPATLPSFAPINVRRLTAIARALILEPELLVLDDPTDDFDPASAREVWLHLIDLCRTRGLAILAAATVPHEIPGLTVLPMQARAASPTRSWRRNSEVLPALRPAPAPSP